MRPALALALLAACTPLVGQPRDAAAPVDAPPRADLPEAPRAACLGSPLGEPGSLLPSAPGWITVARGIPGLQTRAMLRDRRGGVVVAGYAPLADARGVYDAVLWRFDAALTPDASFGDGGALQVDGVAERPGVDVILDGATDPDGALVFAGWNAVAGGVGNRGLALRLRPDGDGLDPSFGTGGVASLGLPDGFSPSGAHVDARGVLLLGTHVDNYLGAVGLAARLDPRGAHDLGFGLRGALVVSDAAAFRDAVPDGDGYLLLGATVDELRPTLTRVDAAGRVDPRFGEGGRAVLRAARDLAPVALHRADDGGTLALAAYIPQQNATRGLQTLVRLDRDGASVPSYGRAGLAEDRAGFIPSVAGGAMSLAVQCDGAVLTVSATSTELAQVHRFTADGRPDLRFGHDGAVTLPRLPVATAGGAVLLDPDGRSALVLSMAADGRLGLHRLAL